MRIVADFLGYLFHLDNISDGMLTKETDLLADAVMNAHWFPERYTPTKNQPKEEISAGKLAREYVYLMIIRLRGVLTIFAPLLQLLGTLHQELQARPGPPFQRNPRTIFRVCQSPGPGP